MPEFDSRTEKNLATLLPGAQELARVFMRRVLAAGINARIIDGSRTFAEQDALYAKGRTRPGPKVTNARGGQSNHNFGIAWDIGIFSGNSYLPESPLYEKAGPIGRAMGLEWGGDWKSLKDRPHYQCKTGKSTKELRQLVQEGKPIPILTPLPPAEVQVFVDGALTNIPAFFSGQRTWVGVKRFTEKLGGTITEAGGRPFMIRIVRGTEQIRVEGQQIDSDGFAKFADLNQLYQLGFTFSSTTKRLEITT
jgi:peptidoglycan LD-endopeptidase CwlK